MASTSFNKEINSTYKILPVSSVQKKPSSGRTTCIETDVSNFKAVVQKFTALREENTPQKHTTHKGKLLPTAYPRPAGKLPSRDMVSGRPGFELRERKQSVVPKIKLNNNGRRFDAGVDGGGKSGSSSSSSSSSSPSSSSGSSTRTGRMFGFSFDKETVSPMSPLENLARGSTSAPLSGTCSAPLDEGMRENYERVSYSHPDSEAPTGPKPPSLLPLFPVHPTRFDICPDKNEDSASSA